MNKFSTKDWWTRKEFSTGMLRELSFNKPRFDLVIPKDVPYESQLFTRWANLMARWASKYLERNREKASTQEELNRFKESAFRHFMQWFTWEEDWEDHAASVLFNIQWAEYVKYEISLSLKNMEWEKQNLKQ